MPGTDSSSADTFIFPITSSVVPRLRASGTVTVPRLMQCLTSERSLRARPAFSRAAARASGVRMGRCCLVGFPLGWGGAPGGPPAVPGGWSLCCSEGRAAGGYPAPPRLVELGQLSRPEQFLLRPVVAARLGEPQAVGQFAPIRAVPVHAERLQGCAGREPTLGRLGQADQSAPRIAGYRLCVRAAVNLLTCGNSSVTGHCERCRYGSGNRRGPVHAAPGPGVVTPDRRGVGRVGGISDDRLHPRLGRAVDQAPAALLRRRRGHWGGADQRFPVLRLVAAPQPHPDRVTETLDGLRLDVLADDNHVFLDERALPDTLLDHLPDRRGLLGPLRLPEDRVLILRVLLRQVLPEVRAHLVKLVDFLDHQQ